MWINNPSLLEAKASIDAGAVACTTNPAYCSKLIKSDREYLNEIIDGVIDSYLASPGQTFNYDSAVFGVYQNAAKPVMELFMPTYEASDGKAGFVTIQDDPRFDQDTAHTIENVLSNRELSPNYMAKIPVIEGGIEAIEQCVKYNVPICATEVFAISQAVTVCETYEAACRKYGNSPVMFLTHISGIFDEYLGKYAKRKGIDIDERVLWQAGVSVARKQFKLITERGYNVAMLGGGARGPHHFTELIGGPHVTMNWSMVKDMLDSSLPIKRSVLQEPDDRVVTELSEKFEVFRLSYEEEALDVKDYAEFGPVQLFRNSFLNGWYTLMAEIASRRSFRAV